MAKRTTTFTITSHLHPDAASLFEAMLPKAAYFKFYKAAMMKVAKRVKKDVLDAFKSSGIPDSGHGFRYIGGDWSHRHKRGEGKKLNFTDKLKDAIRIGKIKGGASDMETSVHILGTRKKTSGTYRLRFFETGVKYKTRHNGWSAQPFFNQATGHIVVSKEIEQAFAEELELA